MKEYEAYTGIGGQYTDRLIKKLKGYGLVELTIESTEQFYKNQHAEKVNDMISLFIKSGFLITNLIHFPIKDEYTSTMKLCYVKSIPKLPITRSNSRVPIMNIVSILLKLKVINRSFAGNFAKLLSNYSEFIEKRDREIRWTQKQQEIDKEYKGSRG